MAPKRCPLGPKWVHLVPKCVLRAGTEKWPYLGLDGPNCESVNTFFPQRVSGQISIFLASVFFNFCGSFSGGYLIRFLFVVSNNPRLKQRSLPHPSPPNRRWRLLIWACTRKAAGVWLASFPNPPPTTAPPAPIPVQQLVLHPSSHSLSYAISAACRQKYGGEQRRTSGGASQPLRPF